MQNIFSDPGGEHVIPEYQSVNKFSAISKKRIAAARKPLFPFKTSCTIFFSQPHHFSLGIKRSLAPILETLQSVFALESIDKARKILIILS